MDDSKPSPPRRVYQRDIAEYAGVSVSTVSRVLSNVAGISESVQQRVLAAAAELGYEGNKEKQSAQLQNVSLLTTLPLVSALDPFHADVLNGVEQACREQGIHLSYATIDNGGSSDGKLLSRLQQNPIDGLVLLSLDDPAVIEQLRVLNLPMVMINVDIPDLPEDSFLPDNHQGALLAMRYLIHHGHERILHITQSKRRTIQRRAEAYRIALAEAGIPYNPQLLFEVEINAEATYEAMVHRLEQRDIDFTAVFCANDLSAMGFMRAAQEIGLRIPDDVSVIGFDDITSAAFLSPPLTTIRIETRELATLALGRLIDRSSDPKLTPIRVSLLCRLIERRSVARLRTEAR
jgi:DNA-binding LacI/PurR family transcriptional regulator